MREAGMTTAYSCLERSLCTRSEPITQRLVVGGFRFAPVQHCLPQLHRPSATRSATLDQATLAGPPEAASESPRSLGNPVGSPLPTSSASAAKLPLEWRRTSSSCPSSIVSAQCPE